MAEKTILDLTDIGTLQSNDKIPIARENVIDDNSTTVDAIKDYVVASDEFSAKADTSDVTEAINAIDESKVDKVPGKTLSSNDYTSEEQDKLHDLPTKEELDELFAEVQEHLTFDDTPTAGSDNPVKSGGIKTALDAKYEKPSGGIPKTDLAADVQSKIDNSLEYEATTDPSSAEMQEEYRRILVPLYQALDDANVATGHAVEATEGATAATTAANYAAATANSKATDAADAAAAANAAAAVADTAAEQGKGSYDSLADRLSAIERGKQNTVSDINTIRENASLAASLSNRVLALERLVNTNDDDAINKFNEIVTFLEGIEDSQTLDGIISGLSTAADSKYEKPQGGIPSSDMTSSVQLSLEKADTAVQYEATSDPSNADLANEYERVLARLYQALIDENVMRGNTIAAINNAYNAQESANEAATLAVTKAAIAQTAADNANAKASEAQTAADNANNTMDAAKGTYSSLAGRLAAMTTTILSKYSKPASGIPLTDLSLGVGTSLGKADSAYQLPYGGIPSEDMSSGVQASLAKANTAVQPAALNMMLKYEASDNPASLFV